MNGVKELIPGPQELNLIPVERTGLIPALPKKANPNPIRKKRDWAARGLIGVTAASLLLNAVQAVIIYILQAGPI